MKKKDVAAAIQKSDFKVWCEQCSIRIAPSEERFVLDDKSYHQHCYTKYRAAASNVRATSIQSRKVPGDFDASARNLRDA
jgi:hypothetical protein